LLAASSGWITGLTAASLAFAESLPDEIREAYADDAARILGAALLSDTAYETLGELCDRFGHRLSGTPQLEACIDWSAQRMRDFGLVNVRKEEVMVPVWVRGEESATLTAPVHRPLSMLGLGRSVGTPPEGIEAEVVVVGSFHEMRSLGRERIEGRIVLYDVPFTSYGETVRYRGKGAIEAAKLGALAALIRSVGPVSLDTPHTGAMRYDDEVEKIPAAAVTIENATMMRRMQERGDTLRVRLTMGAQTLDDALSHNLVGEVLGSERPEEIVVIGGHIDSWDVGDGAQDDGVGCVISLDAARLIHELGLRPRRTIRVVLFTNEESGMAGGKAYLEAHRHELAHHVAAIESDTGNGLASGFRLDVRPRMIGLDPETRDADLAPPQKEELEAVRGVAKTRLETISPLLRPLGADMVLLAGSGVDISPLVKEGVVGLGVHHDTSRYWDIHHTAADTFDKIVKEDLDRNVATMAIMAYVLADMPGRILDVEFPATP
jgi:carboxypeptidase Q